jgi:hypothetical protein
MEMILLSMTGNLFDNPTETDLKLKIEDVTLTNPCKPSR